MQQSRGQLESGSSIHLWPTWSPSSLLRFLAAGKGDPVGFFTSPCTVSEKVSCMPELDFDFRHRANFFYAVYNIGNSNPENLLDFVQILSEELVRAGVLPADYDFEAHKELVPMQPGDVPVTFADTEPLERDFGFKPHTPLREGLRKFAEWYKEFYME